MPKSVAIPRSNTPVREQARRTVDEDKIALVEAAFGKVDFRCILYWGETQMADDVTYLKVEECLWGLYVASAVWGIAAGFCGTHATRLQIVSP